MNISTIYMALQIDCGAAMSDPVPILFETQSNSRLKVAGVASRPGHDKALCSGTLQGLSFRLLYLQATPVALPSSTASEEALWDNNARGQKRHVPPVMCRGHGCSWRLSIPHLCSEIGIGQIAALALPGWHHNGSNAAAE